MEFKYECVSADNHMRVPFLPFTLFQDRVAGRFREQAPTVVQADDGQRQWVVEGRPWSIVGTPPGRVSRYSIVGVAEEPEPGVFRASTPRYRLEDMDRDGVGIEIFNGPFETLWDIKDSGLRIACIQAANNWIREFYEESGGRLIGLFVLPSAGPDEAIRELNRVAQLGLPTGVIFDWAHAPEPVWHEMWEPVWAAAAEANLPINLHVGGGGTPQGGFPAGGRGGILQGYNHRNVELIHAAAFTLPLGEIICALAMSGILDRHPEARFVIEEAGIAWVEYLMWRLDCKYDEGMWPHYIELSDKPSELIRRQVYLTYEEEGDSGIKRIPDVGVERVMWASDYPGSGSTWPESQEKAIKQLDDLLGEEMRRKVSFENAVRLYNLAPVAMT